MSIIPSTHKRVGNYSLLRTTGLMTNYSPPQRPAAKKDRVIISNPNVQQCCPSVDPATTSLFSKLTGLYWLRKHKFLLAILFEKRLTFCSFSLSLNLSLSRRRLNVHGHVWIPPILSFNHWRRLGGSDIHAFLNPTILLFNKIFFIVLYFYPLIQRIEICDVGSDWGFARSRYSRPNNSFL